MRILRRAALLACLCASVEAVAQMPAGTRDVKDQTRAEEASAKVRAAEESLEKGEYAAARVQLEALAAAHPKDAQILFDLGYADEHVNDDAAAAKAYAAAVAVDKTMAMPLVALGLLEARGGNAAAAREHLAAAAAMPGADADLRARAYRAMARLDATTRPADASADLLAAIRLTRETPEDTALSASLAARSGDVVDAEAAYRRVLDKDPADAEVAVGLARVLMAAKRAGEAVMMLAPAVRAHPDDLRVASAEAAALAATGQAAEAAAALAPFAQREPGNIALQRQLGRLYLAANQPANAEAAFRQVAAAAPGDPAGLDDLGTSLVRGQKYAAAQAVLVQAVRLRDKFRTPDEWADAAGHLAFAASKNGDPKTCLQALALRATVQPNTGPTLFLEAASHDTLHEYKEATRAYRAFLAADAGAMPNEEFEARHRIVAIEHLK